jgi:hypothetical protein
MARILCAAPHTGIPTVARTLPKLTVTTHLRHPFLTFYELSTASAFRSHKQKLGKYGPLTLGVECPRLRVSKTQSVNVQHSDFPHSNTSSHSPTPFLNLLSTSFLADYSLPGSPTSPHLGSPSCLTCFHRVLTDSLRCIAVCASACLDWMC